MAFKICHNCGEKVVTLTEKCPKCGIIPKKAASPILIGFFITVFLLAIIIITLILF